MLNVTIISKLLVISNFNVFENMCMLVEVGLGVLYYPYGLSVCFAHII